MGFIQNKKLGFTLIELLVVIAIIGLLASVVLVSLNATRTKSRDLKRKADLSQLQKALELYYDKYGAYPSTSGSWWSTCNAWAGNKTTSGANGWIPNVAPEFVSQLPLDPKRGSSTGALTGPTGANDTSQYCYIYNSNGIDYKVATHCATETGAVPAGADFNKGTGGWSCGDYHFGVYTPGAVTW